MVVEDIIRDVKEIIGQCDEEIVFSRLTDAIEVLRNKSQWNPQIGTIDICSHSDGKTIALPRDVDTPMAVNICGKPAFNRNKWFEYHFNGPGTDRQVPWAWDDQGMFPTFMDIVTYGNLIAIVDLKTDLNAKVRVFGFDNLGKFIRTQEPDGEWKDGFEVPVNLITDFPNNIPVPDPTRIFSRIFTPGDMSQFESVNPHDLVTGALVELELVANPLPDPLEDGASYYVRVIDNNTVTLHTSQSGALTGTNQVIITSAASTSQIRLTDRRQVRVLTQFETATAHNIKTGFKVEFTAATMPEPLEEDVDYFARVIDSTHFTVHNTLDEAENNVNPIDCTTPGNAVVAHAKTPTNPITTITFTVNHNFRQGDAVEVTNATGSFPTPLLPGVTYFVRYISVNEITLHNSLADATNNVNPIILTDNGSGTTTVVKTLNCSASLGTNNNITAQNHGLNEGDFVLFTTNGTMPTPVAQNTTYKVATPMSANTFSLTDTSDAAVNITVIGSGQLFLLISRAMAVGFNDQWSVDASTLETGASVKLDSTGVLPAANPALDSVTNYFIRKLTDEIIELYTTQAYAEDEDIRVSASRERTSNVATVETNAAHNLTTGDFVNISGLMSDTDGVLATVTINSGGTGYVNGETVSIVDGSGHTASGTIAVTAGAITAITITDGGSGFSPTDALTVTGSSADANVDVATVTDDVDNSLTSTYNGKRIQITVTSATEFTYPSSGLDEPNTADIDGQIVISPIQVTGLGAGEISIVLDRNVTVVPFSSDLSISSSQFLKEGAIIRFETDGTLPAPLLTATDYVLHIENGLLQVFDGLGVQVELTTIGSGTHHMTISRVFSVVMPTSFVVPKNNYDDGDAVVVQTTGTLPSPLVAGTTYYVRRLDDDNIELYDTSAHAIDTAFTTGRIEPTDAGDGVHTLVQTLANFNVAKITRVSLSERDGFLSLYAWDYGRTNNLTLIGNYYPDETEPSYRRIRVANCTGWIRMKYLKRDIKIRSVKDFIPLSSKWAILSMLKSLDFLQKEFVEKSQAYSAEAVKFLSERDLTENGPESITIQVNDTVYGNTHDYVE